MRAGARSRRPAGTTASGDHPDGTADGETPSPGGLARVPGGTVAVGGDVVGWCPAVAYQSMVRSGRPGRMGRCGAPRPASQHSITVAGSVLVSVQTRARS